MLYFFVLAWMLLGIMLISDVFMSAIEEITGQEIEKTVVVNGEKEKKKVKVRTFDEFFFTTHPLK